jgi:hypothetical protein
LLVAFIPGLLMLATFGLERLETGLAENTVTARDVAEFLAQAEPIDVGTLARKGMPEALDCLHRRIGRLGDEPLDPTGGAVANNDRLLVGASISGPGHAGLPRPPQKHSGANRQFGPPQHANRV